MSKAFNAWEAEVETTCYAIERHDHAWLAANTEYAHCPGCGKRLPKEEPAEETSSRDKGTPDADL